MVLTSARIVVTELAESDVGGQDEICSIQVAAPRDTARRAVHIARAAAQDVQRPSSTARPSTRTTGMRSVNSWNPASAVMSRTATATRTTFDQRFTVRHPSSQSGHSGRVRNSINGVRSVPCALSLHSSSSACWV